MKRIDVGQAISILANVGVIAGIVFLGFELRQNSITSRLEAAQAYANSSYELDLRLAENPSLVDLLLAPADGLTASEAFRADRFRFSVLRTWESGFYLNRQGVLDDDLWSGQVAFMKSVLIGGAAIGAYREDNRHFFSQSFNQFLDEVQSAESE